MPCQGKSKEQNRIFTAMHSETFSHVNGQGDIHMVDITEKTPTRRSARAKAVIQIGPAIQAALQGNDIVTPKGSVFQTAQLAGIMAAKKTSDLIPLCHPLAIEKCTIAIQAQENGLIHLESCVEISGKTGVEMEALTAVTVAALTLYDMCKSISTDMVILEIRVLEKTGGKTEQFDLVSVLGDFFGFGYTEESFEQLLQENPIKLSANEEIAWHACLALGFYQQQNYKKAKEHAILASEQLETLFLTPDDDASTQRVEKMAAIYHLLSLIHTSTNDMQAEFYVRHTADVWRSLTTRYPDNPRYAYLLKSLG